MNQKNILILDTSTDACTLALLAHGEIFTFHELGKLRHNQLLIPGIQELLNQAQIKPTDLQEIYFGHGPGSFTGTRISAALAMGLAMGANIKPQSLSSFELLAQGIYNNFGFSHVLILQDAQKNQAYLAGYEFINHEINTLISPCLINPAQILEKLSPHDIVSPQVDRVGADLRVRPAGEDREGDKFLDLPWSGTGNAWFLLQDKLQNILPDIKNLTFNPQAENWQPRAEDGFELIIQSKIYPPEINYLREASDWLISKI